MKKLLIKSTLFLFIILCIIIVGILFLYHRIDTGNYYKLNKNYENLVFGHSHTECAFNDSLIDNTLNLSNSGEGIFYTYFKVKKVIENNKTNNLFLSFTNNYIDHRVDSIEIWREREINRWYSKYAANLDKNDLLLLLNKNPKALIQTQSLATKNYLTFAFSNQKSIIEHLNWGKYKYLKREKIDSLLIAAKKSKPIKTIPEKFEYAKYGLIYFDKIIAICKQKNINVYLVRSPIHESKWKDETDPYLENLVKGKFKNIPFLDFKYMKFENTEFGDFTHLNYKGARKFSTFFNNLLQNGLLKKQDKQKFINQEIAKLNKV